MKSNKFRLSINILVWILIIWFVGCCLRQNKFKLLEPVISLDDPFLIINENIDHAGISNDQNVFFIETHDSEFTQIHTRQACSVEAAARAYPNKKVFVMFLTKTYKVKLKNSIQARTLLGYKNVFFKYLNVEEFARGTPMEEFIKSGKLDSSKFILSHTSDMLRILTLWKFGGTYLDLDVIALRSTTLTDYACFESPELIGSAILNLAKTSKDIALLVINRQTENFNGSDWIRNGPNAVTETFKKFCRVGNGTFDTSCKGFNLLPKEDCYQIGWEEWKKFFQEGNANEVKQRAEKSYFIHLWNKLSDNDIGMVDSKAAIINIAAEFCPKILYSIDKYF